MPRFTFKLEGVLEQRRHVERQRQRELATAQQKLLRLQAELDALAAVKRSSAADLRTIRKLSAATLAAHQHFALATRQKASSLRRQLAEANGEVDHAQVALLEAAKQRKVMEKLREREHARWLIELRKQERVESDEVSRRSHVGIDAGI